MSTADVTFRTHLPLSQEAGAKLWELAHDFGDAPGAKHYRFKMSVAGDVQVALVMALASIREIVAEEQVKPVDFLDIRAYEEGTS